MQPELFVSLRFLVATLLLLPFILLQLKSTTKHLLISGIILGVINSLSYVTQTIGLQTVDPARVAFITGLNVLFVPFLLPLFRLGKPTLLDCICAVICLVGLYILTGANLRALSSGDLWVFICAIFFALSIVYIQLVSQHLKNSLLLTFYQILFTVPLAGLFTWHANVTAIFSWQVVGVIIFCALFATIGTLFIQIKYQHYTTATKAALIFTLEPVFASIFSFLINGEALSKNAVIGGMVILFSIALPELIKLLGNMRIGQTS